MTNVSQTPGGDALWTWQTSQRYVPGAGVDQRVAMVNTAANGTATDRYYYHVNHLGTVIAMVSETGTVSDHYIYTPFGIEEPLVTSGNPFRYTGRRYDAETSFYYYRARYYSPEIGRFLQTDPIGYADQMNLYAYVGNSPLMATDPSGLAFQGGRISNARRASEDEMRQVVSELRIGADGARRVAGILRGGASNDIDQRIESRTEEMFGGNLSVFQREELAARMNVFADNMDELANNIDGNLMVADSMGTDDDGNPVVGGTSGQGPLMLLTSHFSETPRERLHTIIHEASHKDPPFGMGLDPAAFSEEVYGYFDARALPFRQALNNPDNWAYSIGLASAFVQAGR